MENWTSSKCPQFLVLFIHKPKLMLAECMAFEVGIMVSNWDKSHRLDGQYGGSSTNFITAPNTVRKPDFWWMDPIRRNTLDPQHNNQLLGVPNFVVEVVSPNDSLIDQRNKLAFWINAGVEV